ncbi:QueT transporter family protein [Enterococcus rivorum]|uniref:QueT transporter family protein n=1 Tax=Enterococcus rivorum TaxID=762845 RepID=A0A1E5KVZ8_9ENTE|nr:QueT transporter family protein [Enterococcus rivorum]MBP2100243.1 putative membrane protein [Enterococcus rivorum]OEH82036.1 hypothetical protein BCR26_14745 [Enterococcus rivorum]
MNSTRLETSIWSVSSLAKMALISALYIVVTLFLAPLSFGLLQLRLSEMFNYLAIYNKRYILAISIGVALSNVASPLGIVDIVTGSLSTFIILSISYILTKKRTSEKKKLAITATLCSLSMFTIAAQMTLFYQLPFFYSWLIIGVGELLSMTLGAFIIYWISGKIDLTK